VATRAVAGIALAALLFAGACGGPGEPPGYTVQSGETRYDGFAAGAAPVVAFLGIPFAEPPVGDLRWQPPRPLTAPPRAWAADRFRAACMQGSHLVRWYRDLVRDFGADPDIVVAPEFSEDCLYLNVWTPDPRPDANLPVMVWIHGGSNKGGWTYEPNYLGARLAQEGVVVVSIPYRLGILGYFSHPDLPVSNFGLLDKVAALRWIHDNIAAFGGDPANVTLFGESSGANAIGYLVASPHARGLFRRVIHQSGGTEFLNVSTRDDNLESGRTLAAALTSNRDAPIAALRERAAEDVIAAAETALPENYYAPVVDGDSLRQPVRSAIADGDMAPIDLVIGTNAHEWRMYLDPETDQDDVTEWIRQYAPAQEAELLALLGDDGTPLQRLDRLVTGRNFVCPSLYFAEQVAAAGRSAYVYYFSRERTGELGASMGSYHGAEIPYVFGTHDDWLPTTPGDLDIGHRMARYWTRFARTGDPNGGGDPAWPVAGTSAAMALRIDADTRAVQHPEAALCASLRRSLER